MGRHKRLGMLASLALCGLPFVAWGESVEVSSADSHPGPRESLEAHPGKLDDLPAPPPLPEGMSLEEVLERAAQPAPPSYPRAMHDDPLRFFVFLEQVEYRIQDGDANSLGWEGQGWVGYDFDRLWIKLEGESIFEGSDEGESATDFLYSRLITAFWNAQIGFQYANGWQSGEYQDRWSGVVSLLGLAPGQFELDSSIYISQDADVTAELEIEYDIRFTQRAVLQPRLVLGLSAQDVARRGLGAGLTHADLGLRMRYEIEREFAPYFGIRYHRLVGQTADLARDEGADRDDFQFFAGLRLAY